MKNLVQIVLATILVTILSGVSSQVFAQEVQVVKLTQTEGEFTTTHLDLEAGQYIFEVSNQGVDKEVGFVIAPQEENGDAGEHIKEGYLAKTIKNGETAQSNIVELAAGTYTYFCPLNPTPQYTITVN